MPHNERLETSVVLPLMLVTLGLHALPHPGFGFHRDEFLYFAMGDRLDPLRMQFPPLIAMLARASRTLFGDTLAAARVPPALGHAALVLLTARITAALGGAFRAQLLAAVAVLGAPLFMRAGTLFQPVVFEQVWWALALLALVELLRDPAQRRWWLALGLALGLAALTKFSAAFLGAAGLACVLTSPLRRSLRQSGPWVALLIAVLVGLPSLTGQAHWDWPFFAQADALRATQLGRVTVLEFVVGQFMMLGPASILMVAGVWTLLGGRLAPTFRAAGVAAAVVFVLLLLMGGKPYYFGPMQPLFLAAGAVAIEAAASRRPWLTPAVASLLLAGSVLLLPLGTPVLPREALARHAAALGVTSAVTTNRGDVLPLPQDFADMIGWEDLGATVAGVYGALTPEQRARTAVVGGNYGRAGALAFFRRALGLPYPIARHGDFYAWGIPDTPIDILVIAGGTIDDLTPVCLRVHEAARTRNPWGVEEEQSVPIHVCEGLRRPLRELWQELGVVWG